MSTELMIPNNPTALQVLGLLDRARLAIASTRHPAEAAQIVVKTEAIAYLAKKAKAAEDIQQEAAAVTINAKLKAGQLLAAQPKNEGAQGSGSNQHKQVQSPKVIAPPTLKEMGIEPNDSSDWQLLARKPEAVREYIKEAKEAKVELTSAGAVRAVKTALNIEANGKSDPPQEDGSVVWQKIHSQIAHLKATFTLTEIRSGWGKDPDVIQEHRDDIERDIAYLTKLHGGK